MKATVELKERRAIETAACTDRFRRLLADRDWDALPERVRARFTKKPARGQSLLYRGCGAELKMSFAGRVLAQAARLIGAPLPLDTDCEARAAIVAVTEAADGDGQIWTRVYSRPSGFPQIIHSTKRFCGPTGLEEHVGGGVGMTLRLSVDASALFFRSVDYFVTIFGMRMTLPGWLTPGEMVVGHHELGGGAFAFTLTLRHPVFGLMIEQTTIFHDIEEAKS
jgi:hypothetical protein